MKQYLKMEDVFDLPILGSRAEFFPLCLNESSAMIAAHAINSHDELVQMNQELLASLEGAESLLSHYGRTYGHSMSDYSEFELAEAAIAKAKGGAA